jgi:hypothetical protein
MNAMSDESIMNASGESHHCIVPRRVPNKDLQRSAEGPEGRRSIKEIPPGMGRLKYAELD